jgi:glycosyltransferase involved in cell wall biosynthesis
MEGMLQRKTIVEWLAAGRKVVLTLHDMAPFTGGCHQSLGCRGYETSCRACPQVRTEFRKLVENRFSHLPDLADFKNQLVVVAPTSWMRNMALQSRHFSSLRIEVIENPIDPSFFESYDRENARADLGIPVGTFVACIVSAQLNNPAKRVEDCIEVFSQACGLASIPGVVLLVGDGGENLSKKYPFAFFVGSGGPEHVAKNLAAADVLLSGSEAESAGMTIREASAQGLASIVVSNGGSDEMITSSEIGRVVKDFSSMKEALFDTISGLQPTKAREQAQKAKELAWAQAEMRNVSRKYVDIYRELQGIGG